jgi:20S proteasome alpha/beta subunit
MHVNDNIILGAGGDYADYQYLKDVIEQKMYVSKSNIYTKFFKISICY